MSRARSERPVLGAPPVPRLPPVHRLRLDNGLEVRLVERPDLPVVDAQLVVRSGAHSDDAAHAGRAYMTMNLLDLGTASRSATRIAEEAELLGASLQTRGSWDFCTVALHVLEPRLEPALELMADLVLRPAFPEEELARKRAERLAAILQEKDDPRTLATHAFAHVAYGNGHPYGLPLGGTADTVAALTREEVTAFYRDRFVPGNAFVVMVGDTTPDRALPLLERLFGTWAPGPAPAAAAHETLPRRDVAIHIVDRPDAPQSELRVGLPGPPRDTTDYFPLLVGNTVLGGSFMSRLNMLLREEKAYTYGAGSSIAFRAGGGPFLASTAVHTDATADAVGIMVREVRRLGEEPMSAAELERAQSYIVLGLPRTFETTSDIAEHVSEVALYGLPDDWFDCYAERVRAVTAADVESAAARWLRAGELVVSVAGGAAAVSKGLESLGIGEVHGG